MSKPDSLVDSGRARGRPRGDRTRARILAGAWELFADRGLEVSMAEVAEAAGISRQALYLHFRTRGGLLIGLVRWADEREGIRGRLEGALKLADPREGLDAFLKAWFDFVPAVYPVARQLLAARDADEEADRAWRDRMDELHAAMLELARSLKRAGSLAEGWTAPAAADFLWSAASMPAWAGLAIERGWGARRTSAVLRRTLRATLLAG